jgi:hypothetical protein
VADVGGVGGAMAASDEPLLWLWQIVLVDLKKREREGDGWGGGGGGCGGNLVLGEGADNFTGGVTAREYRQLHVSSGGLFHSCILAMLAVV